MSNAVLEKFNKLGNQASCHFADDSGSEWGVGNKLKNEALDLYESHPELQEDMRDIAVGFLWSLSFELSVRDQKGR